MRSAVIKRALLCALFGAALGACAGRHIARVQSAHGQEFSCDRRYVQVERLAPERWQARGCGFEAEWTCRDGVCEVDDARAWGIGGP